MLWKAILIIVWPVCGYGASFSDIQKNSTALITVFSTGGHILKYEMCRKSHLNLKSWSTGNVYITKTQFTLITFSVAFPPTETEIETAKGQGGRDREPGI